MRLPISFRRSRVTLDGSPPGVEWRMALLMFLGFLPLAMWSVPLGTYIGLNTGDAGKQIFSPGFVGIAYSGLALGSIFAPLVAGAIADRLYAAERVLCVLFLGGGCLLWWLSSVESQWTFFAILVAYFQCYAPTGALATAVAMHQLPDPLRQFPRARMLGTMAWVVGGWFIGFGCPLLLGGPIEGTVLPMQIGAVMHVVAALYCLTLPHTPPPLRGNRFTWAGLFGWDAVKLFRRRSFAVLVAAAVLVAISFQFYISYTNFFLNRSGVSGAAGKMAFGQLAEVLCILLLPLAVHHWGIKWTVLVGILAWSVRFALFAAADEPATAWLVYPAILLHGVCYTFVYIAGQVYVNEVAGRTLRASAQGLFSLATMGFGLLAGALVSGWAQTHFLTPPGIDPPPYDWQSFWLLPCGMAVLPAVLMLWLFREPKEEAQESAVHASVVLAEPPTVPLVESPRDQGVVRP